MFTNPPEKLKVIDIRNNNFEAPAFVPRKSFSFVSAHYTAMGGVFDENGVLYTENGIEKCKDMRQKWVMATTVRNRSEG